MADPTTAILQALQANYTAILQTAVPVTDPLYPKVIKIAPLQDDPTLMAPYVIFRPDPDLGREPARFAELPLEFGASWQLYYFQTAVGTPRAFDRLTAQSQVGELTRRIEQYLNLDPTLGGLTADEFQLTAGPWPHRVLQVRPRIYGGENEWYGQAIISHFFLLEEFINNTPMVYS